MTLRSLKIGSALAAALALSACGTVGKDGRTAFPETASKAFYPDKTQTQNLLEALPAPAQPVAVAVYGFTDQTGMFKPSETGQTLSRAVTQGAGSILVKALQAAGGRQWFTIVERENLKNLLNERQIIREMRERYLGEQGVNPQALPALLFAGVLLEGGIVGYDTNTVTGGAGAAFLGIGAKSEYRQDTVTVYLRAVSVRTGEVLTSVNASKTIASQSIGANAFRFVGFRELLQAEAGYTTNEPDQVALQQAIEKAVYALVMEGVDLKLWQFADAGAGWPLLVDYKRERDGKIYPLEAAQAFNDPRSAPQRVKPKAEEPARQTSPRSDAGREERSVRAEPVRLPPMRLQDAPQSRQAAVQPAQLSPTRRQSQAAASPPAAPKATVRPAQVAAARPQAPAQPVKPAVVASQAARPAPTKAAPATPVAAMPPAARPVPAKLAVAPQAAKPAAPAPTVQAVPAKVQPSQPAPQRLAVADPVPSFTSARPATAPQRIETPAPAAKRSVKAPAKPKAAPFLVVSN